MRHQILARPAFAPSIFARLRASAIIGATLSVVMAHPLLAAEGPPPNDGLNATYWLQNSVEYKANALGMYTLAKLRLDQALADKDWTALPDQGAGYQSKPPAVILDVDETVLDNSPYQAWIVKANSHYSSKTWGPFVNTATSRAIPGSLDYIKYATSKGVMVFYVSNRKAPLEDGTRRNLTALGYPVSDKEDVVLLRGEKKEWGSKKGTRRAHVAANYRVVALFGDNLGDFVDGYGGTPAERATIFEQNQTRWGHDWFMIPNPTYGSWEGAAIGNDWKAKPEVKRQMKLDKMDAWIGPQ